MSVGPHAAVSRLVSGIADIEIIEGNDIKNVNLFAICVGAIDNNLKVIPPGILTLRHGRISRKVNLFQGDASDCVAIG